MVVEAHRSASAGRAVDVVASSRTAARTAELRADVCVIGAGPVGLALAHALRGSGVRVAILESGSHGGDVNAQRLNEGDVEGDPCGELSATRHRGVGGTAHLWNTEIGGRMTAKYTPLDEVDFETRDVIPFGGWPFRRSALEPHYRVAHALIGLGSFGYDAADRSTKSVGPVLFDDSPFVNRLYRFGNAERFTTDLPATLADAPTVTLLLGATVTDPEWRAGGTRLAAVRWLGPKAGGIVRADRFVLAAGGIENARLLLLWTRVDSGGPPPADWLGRGFMEHPVDSSLELIIRRAGLGPDLGFYAPHDDGRRFDVMGRLGLSAETLRGCDLPNASVRIVPVDDDPPRGRLRSTASRALPRRLVRGGLARVARALLPAPKRTGPIRYHVLIDLEQPPHPDNRVRLSSRCDELGQPRAELHWRWRDPDESNRGRLVAHIAEGLDRAGIGTVVRNNSRPINPAAHHHAGTTRMHVDPRQGVVDQNLRVHGVDNLFVAGSSVFPTAGFANPTLTAVALALRLADHLAAGRS